MNKEIRYWKWKSTIIDFNTISDEPVDYDDYTKKKDLVFRYLGIPDNDIHEWYNGGFSSEYNRALKYAEELGLIEDYIDYDDIIYELKEQLQQKEDIIYKIKKCIEEKEEYYGDYMGDGNYTMYSTRGANDNRIAYIKSNLIKQILNNKG